MATAQDKGRRVSYDSIGTIYMGLYFERRVERVLIRDVSKFIGYPSRDHQQEGEDFFSKKNRGAQTFFEKY